METSGISIEDQLVQYGLAVKDPLEFFKHVKLLDATTNSIIPYELWPHLVEFIRATQTYNLIDVLKAKQEGISWTLAGLALWECYKTGANILTLSRGQQEASDLLAKSKFIWTQLPKWLQLEKDHDGAFLMSFKGPKSRINALPSTEDAGIGHTASIVIRDEVDFHDYAEQNFSAVKPTIDAGGKMFQVSTPSNNADSWFKNHYRAAKDGTNNFKAIFIGAMARPDRTDDWASYTFRDYSTAQRKKVYPLNEEEALSPIAGESFFDVDRIAEEIELARDATETRQGSVYIFDRPRNQASYVAGADAGSGVGGDASVLWIESLYRGQRGLCAIIYTRDIRPDAFAYLSLELLGEYFKPMVVGGNDPSSSEFLRSLLNLGYPSGKVYWSNKVKGQIGFVETSKTRQEHLSALEKTIREGYVIPFKPAALEFLNFQWSKGEIVRPEGAHDDCVLAAAKANFARSIVRDGRLGITTTRYM
jgi:hypothetical protein